MADKRRLGILVAVAVVGGGLYALSLHRRSDAVPPVIRGKAPGLELHFYKGSGVALKAGDTIGSGDSIGAVYHNLGNESLWALIFAYDALGNLYWLEPHHAIGSRSEDLSVGLAPTEKERSVGSAAQLRDLPAGPLTVFALVTPGIMVTSRIERLDPDERDRQSLLNRFPDAVVVELPLTMVPQAM